MVVDGAVDMSATFVIHVDRASEPLEASGDAPEPINALQRRAEATP
jgi:hypothetical protein